MRRLTAHTVLGLAFAALVAAAALGGVAASSTTAACKPGTRTINGVKVVVFCGPAKATAKFGGTTVTFRNGACVRSVSKTWAINVGTATVAPKAPKFKYFGITIGKLRGDGTYRKASVGFQWKGKSYGVTGAVVTIKGKATRGTFKGRLDQGARRAVSGSFTC